MAEQDDAQVQEIRARLEAATTDVVDELAGFRDFDGEWTANKTHRRRASPGGVRETFYAAGRISGLAEGDSAHADIAYLLARLDALTAERDAARAWSARWKAVAKRLWVGIHRSLDQSELLAARMLKAEAERDALTAERDADRAHLEGLQISYRNASDKAAQLGRALETATRSVDYWREAWEQKHIELEQAESERDALAARLAAAEAVEKVLRDGLRDLRGYSVSNWCLVDSTLAFAEKAALAGSREQPQGEEA